MELWKLNGIPVSSYGRVFTKIKGLHFGHNSNGYRKVHCEGKAVKVHKLVEKAFNLNPCPQVYSCTDHINQLKDCNFISNLRPSTGSLNLLNTNALGYGWKKRDKMWEMQLEYTLNGEKNRISKYFKTTYLARQYYIKKKNEIIILLEDAAYQESLKYGFNPLWKCPINQYLP